jgi:putative hemolysin
VTTWESVLVVLALIAVEALFVAAEISLVSLREQQVRRLSERSRGGDRVARLVADPNRFLSSVQIGVTTSTLLSSAFGAITLSARARDALQREGMSRTPAAALGFIGVTLVISFVTLVLGELVPKRLALQRAERTATLAAPGLDLLARASRPVIWLLSRSTNAVVRLLGGDPHAGREAITEEELRGLVAAHESLSSEERRLIDDVFNAGERAVREVMRPRTEVDFLDAATAVSRAARDTAERPHSRYPVVRGSHDDVVGFVHLRDLIGPGKRGLRVGDVAREVMMLPATRKLLAALSDLRRGGQHLAVVVDEYGGTAGIVTLEDIIEELVGEIRDEYDPVATDTRRLRSGAMVVDGLLNLDDFAEATGLTLADGPYETAAGFLVNQLGHLPRPGEGVEVAGARLSVDSMDGRRVERLRITPLPQPPRDDDSSPAPSPA